MDDYHCHLCKQEFEVFTSRYSSGPFIDGRKYKILCENCLYVPKMHSYNEKTEEYTTYDSMSPNRLHTVKEMEEFGCHKGMADKSVRAVKLAIKKAKEKSKAKGAKLEDVPRNVE